MLDESLIVAELDLEMDFPDYDETQHYRRTFRFRMWTQLLSLNIAVYEIRSPFYIFPTTLFVSDWKEHSMLYRLLDNPPEHSHLHIYKDDEQHFVDSIKKIVDAPIDYCQSPCAIYYMRGVDLIARYWLLFCFTETPSINPFDVGR